MPKSPESVKMLPDIEKNSDKSYLQNLYTKYKA